MSIDLSALRSSVAIRSRSSGPCGVRTARQRNACPTLGLRGVAKISPESGPKVAQQVWIKRPCSPTIGCPIMKRQSNLGTRMNRHLTLALYLAALTISAASSSLADVPVTQAAITRDGSHDFDFDLGVWHTEITRRL